MPGNMGMSGAAGKIKLSLLLSALPRCPPPVRTDDRSKLPPPPLFSLRPSIRSSSAQCSAAAASSSPRLRPSVSPRRMLHSGIPSSHLLHSLCANTILPTTTTTVMDSLPGLLLPFPLSSSLFPQASNARRYQSVDPAHPRSVPL